MADTRTADAPARVCRWFGGKQAALSLRFDDSHPTHIEVAVPLLDELGLIGTFLVNPGNDSYKKHQSVWEGAVLQRGHELADHTWNHRGAKTDAEADEQIGRTANLLRRLQPGHQQITLETGGSTLWLQRKPFEFFSAKYHLIDINNADHPENALMSCTVGHPWFSPEAFTQRMEKTIAAGGWVQPYFHQIDETGHLRIPPATFRKLLETVAAHRAELWQAGLTPICEYQEERDGAAVWPWPDGDDALTVDLTCATDPKLYTQPLTLEVDLPTGVESASVTDSAGSAIAARIESAAGRRVVHFDVPPVDARFTIRAAGIGAASRSRIPAIRAPGAHPYVMFSVADVPALMAKTSDPLAKQMWDGIIHRADSILGNDAASEPRSDHPWVRMGQELSPIDTLAFAYAMTRNPAYGAAAASRLETLAGEDWWHTGTGTAGMLNTSAAVSTLGLGYDWTYDALTEAQRARIREAIVEHGIKPTLAANAKNAFWPDWYHCNWGSVIHGEVGTAALALLGEAPEASEMVRLSHRKIWHYMHALNKDGSWGESATYAAFAWSNGIMFADGLRRVTGDDLFAIPRLRKLPMWFIALLEPGGANFVPFSNCQKGSGSPASVLFRLAREYRDGYAQLVARQMIGHRHGGSQSFLWYDPALQAKPLSELPLDTLLRDLDWAFLRSSREDPKATLFGLKGGHKEWDHSHHDTNSFVLYAYGKPLLIDLFYPYHIWGCLTEAHNTVMVNGKEQAGHVNIAGGRDDPDHRGIVAGLVNAPWSAAPGAPPAWYARIVGDASLAYEKENLSSFVRETMYLRHTGAATPPDYFVMLDDIETPQPSQIDWLLHTYGDAKFSDNVLTVTQDDAAVDVTLISPEKLSFEVSEKKLEDISTPKPFDSAEVVKILKFRPADQASRTFFLSVLAPRAASAAAPLTVTPVRQSNVLGADIVSGGVRDLALFALDAPSISANGVEVLGRSCFVRTAGGRVQSAVLHSGQRLTRDGVLLFETNSTGHALLTFGEDGVEVKLDLYDTDQVRIHVDRTPVKIIVDGKDHVFEYDSAGHFITVNAWNTHSVRVQY